MLEQSLPQEGVSDSLLQERVIDKLTKRVEAIQNILFNSQKPAIQSEKSEILQQKTSIEKIEVNMHNKPKNVEIGIHQKIKSTIEDEVQKLQLKLKGELAKVEKELISLISITNERVLEMINLEFSQKIKAEINRMKKMEEENKKLQERRISQQKAIDMGTPFIHHFQLRGNKITFIKSYEDEGKKYGVQVLLNSVIDLRMNFETLIVKTQKKGIRIGVVDRLRERTERRPTQPNAVYYECWNGKISYGNKGKWESENTGSEAEEGETIITQVDLWKGTITWASHSKTSKTVIKASLECPILREPNREFVPYWEMAHELDCIEWSL